MRAVVYIQARGLLTRRGPYLATVLSMHDNMSCYHAVENQQLKPRISCLLRHQSGLHLPDASAPC
jgi:hypothetical protein